MHLKMAYANGQLTMFRPEVLKVGWNMLGLQLWSEMISLQQTLLAPVYI